MSGLIEELKAFDSRTKKPLPPAVRKWRNRWVKAIKKEWVLVNEWEATYEKYLVNEKYF